MSEQTVPRKENRMGTESIPRLLFSMAIPMMLSMMVQALYNVVDSIFVAKLSEDALTARGHWQARAWWGRQVRGTHARPLLTFSLKGPVVADGTVLFLL